MICQRTYRNIDGMLHPLVPSWSDQRKRGGIAEGHWVLKRKKKNKAKKSKERTEG